MSRTRRQTMIHIVLATGTIALSLAFIPEAEAGCRHRRLPACPWDAPPVHVHRSRPMLPSHIPYRDPGYRPAPLPVRPADRPPVVLGLAPAHNPNAPLYNEPPPRFLHD
ncbi:hypothetical protein MBUL_04162 [Methylobacterium bullatum]|uniref:Uncharacterized protein n=1 Tax=Methylobacterium bullatum TaxID=570505 RepID=A0A679JFA2_9HYPH|nr:hypothetical protein MBUL_04162 [Methylobacterium bullatum]